MALPLLGWTHALDPDDGDPSQPAPSQVGPVSFSIFADHGGDGDSDYVPADVTVTWLDNTVGRRFGAEQTLMLDQHTSTTTLDEDHETPVPFDIFDQGWDWVPDDAEFWICQVQDGNRDEDGTCTDENNDGFGDDYHPPADPPNPWELT